LIEGAAFSFVYGLKLLEELELDVKVIRVCDSDLFQSEVFTESIATLINCSIEVYDTCSLVGAAKAAGVGLQPNLSAKEVLKTLKPIKVITPASKSFDYQRAYENWLFHLNKLLASEESSTQDLSEKFEEKPVVAKETEEKDKKIYAQSIKLISATALLKETKDLLNLLSQQKLKQADQKHLQAIVLKLEDFSSGENWADFEPHFNLIHGNLYKRLKTNFPELTASDIKICACIKMQMSSKDIAGRLHLSLRTVETKRYRLRQKLQLQKGENLTQFIEQF